MGKLGVGTLNRAKAPAENLASVELLSTLTGAERGAVEKRCRWKRFNKDEQIIDRETDSTDVYFIAAGAVRIVNYSLAGREITFDDIEAGGYFGELAALDGAKRSASVVATTATLTASLDAAAFREVLATHPTIALALLQRLARVIRQSTGRIMDLSSLGAHNRIYAELLREARAGGLEGNRAMIKPIPVHADLAGRVSTTRETVARVLNDLARKKIVEREKGALAILDVRRLSAMVEEFRGD
jgi:CRP/FNR family transcriptional regulator, cyclic AMP receptor protein